MCAPSQIGQQNYHSMLVPCHDTKPGFMIFMRVSDLQELITKFLNVSSRAMTPRCLNYIPISGMGPRNLPEDTHVIFQPALVHWSMCLYLNFNYAHKGDTFLLRTTSLLERSSGLQETYTKTCSYSAKFFTTAW